MRGQIVWNIAAPMIGLGAFLLGLGVFAAWNVHQRQRTNSELIIREVHGMLAIDELHMAMREIRYQANIFLRTHETEPLEVVGSLHHQTDRLLERAKGYARTPREQELIQVVDQGYREFFGGFQPLANSLLANDTAGSSSETLLAETPPSVRRVALGPEQLAEFTRLTDAVLSEQVMAPLRECLAENQAVVERTNEASEVTAQHLKIGFLLLGLCGGTAGLLMGIGIARAIGQSIVQLNVSIRSAVGRLSDVTGPVTVSHTGDWFGLEAGLRKIERDIGSVVERLQQREMEVLRTEQLARVGQLAAGLAHELRNPLMPMKMLVQSALERGEGSGLSGRSLHVLNDEIARMEVAIQEFLDFARPPLPEKLTVDLRPIVSATLELIATRARGQGVELDWQPSDEPRLATVDPVQIRQLLLNLLLNALDAQPRGGVIELALAERTRAEMPPEQNSDSDQPLGDGAPDAWLALIVADHGPGIAADAMAEIFEPFVTTKETGTGLGLSICQRIAAAHGGRLTAGNRAAGGAEFILWLPRDTMK